MMIVQVIDVDLYGEYELVAKKRIGQRDIDDWPIIATALALECLVWTEDTDLFGTGIATWTTSRIEFFVNN